MDIIKSNDAIIEIGSLNNSSLKKTIKSYSKIIVLVDENTKILLTKLKPILGEKFYLIKIKSGENKKNLTTCETIWNELTEKNIDRNGLLINLGGGVITDMGGFVASTYRRGIQFINIPTTLLSMVDASVGGKTGVNFNGLKNNIGMFNEPKVVYCDTSLLSTLPKRELVSGIGEILKHALITDKNYWLHLINIPFDEWNLNDVVLHSIKIKNNIILKDPFEKNERKKLNFGHTIGHAIESHSLANNISILHGEAVAIGIICEAHLSFMKNLISKSELIEISKNILKLIKPPKIKIHHSRLLELMTQDKKNENNSINFTLLNGIGSSIINQGAAPGQIIEALKYYEALK